MNEISQEAKKRKKVNLFYQKDGLKQMQEGLGVKRTTLFDWQKKYCEFGVNRLINGDKRSKRKRPSTISQQIKDFIKSYRKE
jgi:hypothetical protein